MTNPAGGFTFAAEGAMEQLELSAYLPALDVLCRCFKDDPHVNWFVGNRPETDAVQAEIRRRALVEYVTLAALSCGQAFVAGGGRAVALWQEGGIRPGGLGFLRANVNFLFRCGVSGARRSLAMEKAAASNLPDGPYLFLWMVGVLPEARGKGIFRQLVQPRLAEADRRGVPVLLETTVERNLGLYGHFGFAELKRYRIEDSPEVVVMERRPQA